MKFKKEKEPDKKKASSFDFLNPNFEESITDRLKQTTSNIMESGDQVGEKRGRVVDEIASLETEIEKLETQYEKLLNERKYGDAAQISAKRKEIPGVIKSLEKKSFEYNRQLSEISTELDTIVEKTLRELHQQETAFINLVSDKLKVRIDSYKAAVEVSLKDLGLDTDVFTFAKYTELRIRAFADFTLT